MKEIQGDEQPEEVLPAAAAAAMAFARFNATIEQWEKIWKMRGSPEAGCLALPMAEAILIRNHVLLCTQGAIDAIAEVERLKKAGAGG